MTPGAVAPLAGAHDHAPVRVRLLHTSAVSAVTVAFVVVGAARSGTLDSGDAGAVVGGATRSGTDDVVVAAAEVLGSGCGAAAGSAGDVDGADDGVAPGDGGGADAARSRDESEFIKYHPAASSTTRRANSAAIAGTRDGSRTAA